MENQQSKKIEKNFEKKEKTRMSQIFKLDTKKIDTMAKQMGKTEEKKSIGFACINCMQKRKGGAVIPSLVPFRTLGALKTM